MLLLFNIYVIVVSVVIDKTTASPPLKVLNNTMVVFISFQKELILNLNFKKILISKKIKKIQYSNSFLSKYVWL